VNLSEVVAKTTAWGAEVHGAREQLERLSLSVHPFDAEQAYAAAALYGKTRHLGLSIGDRACLSLAQTLDRPALTADRTWDELRIGVTVELIR
jgi:PIN domain nuclease of toxin-antitoxin system